MAAAEHRLLESPTDILGQITQRLQKDGLSPQCGDGEKLLYLWRLNQQTESALKQCRENEERLKEAQTEEMQEVENYVEHIRHLSDEREALIQELENENEQLKMDLDQVRAELGADARKETSEMLTQQGLGEIASAPPNEQMAYLLVERARLLDELESAHNQTPTSPSTGYDRDSQELKQILEQERKDFEQELGQQRESASLMHEQLRKEHEEEISALMDENSKLEEELQEAKKKVQQLQKQMEKKTQHQNEKQESLAEERTQFRRERDTALKEKKVLLERQDTMEMEKGGLEREKASLLERVSTLEKEKVLLEQERDSVERERDSWRDSSTESALMPPFHSLRLSSPLRSSNDMALRKVIEEKTKLESEMIQLRGQIKTLHTEKEKAEEECKQVKVASEKLQVTIQQLQMKNKNLRQEVEEMEAQLEEAQMAAEEAEKSEKEISQKFRLVQGEVKTLKGEAQRSNTLQDIVDILSNEKTELTSTLDRVRSEMHKVLAEKEDLLCQNQQFKDGGEKLLEELKQAKDNMAVLECERNDLFQERDELINTRDMHDGLLSSLRNELMSAQEVGQRMSSTSEQLERDNKQLQERLEKVILERDSLRHTQQELAKQELIVTHMKEQNSGLTQQLSELQTQLEWARRTEQSLIDSQQMTQKAHSDSEKRLTGEIDELRVKLQQTLSELQAAKVSQQDQVTVKSALMDQLSHTESRLQETLQQKTATQQQLKYRASELEMQVREIEVKLAEKTRVADMYEDERRQRMELEAKVQELNQEQEFELTSLRSEAQREKTTRCDLEFKLQELEQFTEELRREKDMLSLSLTTQVSNLESQVKQLQNDLSTAQQEMASLLHKYDQAVLEAEDVKAELASLQALAMDHASQMAVRSINIEELEATLKSTRNQLQEALNALNQANTRIAQLEEQRAESKAELKQSLTDIRTLVFQKEVTSSKYEEMENTMKSLKQDLNENISALMAVKSQLKDKNSLLDTVRQEMELLNQELEHLRETSASVSEEKNQQNQRLKIAEERIRQLEKDSDDLAGKLSDSIHQREQLAEKLEKEKLRNTDSCHQSARYVEQLESDLNAANKHIRSLREELQHQQSSVFRLEASNLGQTAKYQSMVGGLESELKDMKLAQRREMDTMTDKLTAMSAECRDAKTELKEKEQTITDLRRELSKTQTNAERLESQLMSESKIRSDIENRSTTREHEMTKVWSQVRMLMEHNNHLETNKKMVQEDLDRKSIMVRQLESSLSSRESSAQTALKEWQSRAEQAEKQVKQLEQDLCLADSKLCVVEQQLKQAQLNHTDMAEKTQQLATVKNQLEGEKLQRTLLDQTVAELKHQVSLLKQREDKLSKDNKDLKGTISDLETRLSALPADHSNSVAPYSAVTSMSESSRQSLMEQICRLQQEVKALQFELLTSNERRDVDLTRLEECKQRTKIKLMKAREFYCIERAKCRDHLRQMDGDLQLTRAALQKELEWKDKMDTSYKQLLEEKRDLISQLMEHEETVRDKARSLSMLQVQTAYLEDKNRNLQHCVDTLTAQKSTLDKLLRDLQHSRDTSQQSASEDQLRSQNLNTMEAMLNFTGGSTTSDSLSWDHQLDNSNKLAFHPDSSLHLPSHSSCIIFSQGFVLGENSGGAGTILPCTGKKGGGGQRMERGGW